MFDDQIDDALEVARRALATDRLAAPLLDALDQQGLRELNDTIEVPLVGVLARMENLGVGIDRAELQRLSDQLAERAAKLAAAVQDLKGLDRRPTSPELLLIAEGWRPWRSVAARILWNHYLHPL